MSEVTSVILDTDIGDDIDDSWALVMLLKMPQLECRLITTTYGYLDWRARLLMKYLSIAERQDIPIGKGTGPDHPDCGRKLSGWNDYPSDQYAGTVYEDGVDALIETVNESPTPITLIANGPLNTVSDGLIRDPSIATRVNLVAMQGSLRRGYNDGPEPLAEYNVRCGIAEAKRVFTAPWKSMAITPLDTCGLIRLSGDRYDRIRHSGDPLLRALIESETVWHKNADPSTRPTTSPLFDCVSVYMADAQHRSLLRFERLNIAVNDAGFIVETPHGMEMDVATHWADKDGFCELLTRTLLSPTVR